MPEEFLPSSFGALLRDLVAWLEAARVEGVVIGGLAAWVMKAVAHRPRDLADIEGVLARNPGVDLERAQTWIREFSSALDRPELLEDFQAIVRKLRR